MNSYCCLESYLLLVYVGNSLRKKYPIHVTSPSVFFKVVNYDGVSKNVTAVGFHEDGKWMFTGGEDSSARIWDLRYCMSQSDSTFIRICVAGQNEIHG